MRRLFLTFSAVLFGIALTISRADAFTIQPPVLEITGDPGTTVETTILLKNDEQDPKEYYVSIQKFIASGESGQQEFLPPEETSGLPSWTYVEAPMVTLGPGEQYRFHVAFRLPSDAKAGGYYEAIFFSTQRPNRPSTNLVYGARTGAIALVTVRGNAKPDFQVVSFEARASKDGNGLDLEALLENDGTLHAKPRMEAVVRNAFGFEVGKLDLNREDGRVLPGSHRRFQAVWSPFFLLGPYHVQLRVESDGASQVVIAETRVTLWPVRSLLIVAGILTLLLGLLWLFRRSVISKAASK